jgi:hypothetical protein
MNYARVLDGLEKLKTNMNKTSVMETPPSPHKHGGPEHHTGMKHDGEQPLESTVEGTLRAFDIITQTFDPFLALREAKQQLEFGVSPPSKQTDIQTPEDVDAPLHAFLSTPKATKRGSEPFSPSSGLLS